MKLIPMTDFVLEQQNRIPEDLNLINNYKVIINYAKFLKYPLELWMLVPCDEKGNPIILPHTEKYMSSNSMYHRELNIYRKAKERVLFEGWNYAGELQIEKDNVTILFGSWQFIIEGSLGLSGGNIYPENIEGLSRIELDLPLTPTAIKQIGL